MSDWKKLNSKDWYIDKDYGDTLVLKKYGDGGGCLVFIIIVALILYFSADPSESDLGKEKYLEKAENFVEEYVLDWQKRNWEGWGWSPSSILNFREPEYEVEIAGWKVKNYKDISNRVEYLGKGFYKVIVLTNTHLKSKNGKRLRVQETFVFQIKRKSKDKYEVLEVEKTAMDPQQEKFNEILKKWTHS